MSTENAFMSSDVCTLRNVTLRLASSNCFPSQLHVALPASCGLPPDMSLLARLGISPIHPASQEVIHHVLCWGNFVPV